MKILFLISTVLFASLAHSDTYDREAVRLTVRESLMKFKDCYNDGVKKNPSLQGKVVVQWDIAGDGYVSAASVKTSTLNDDAVHKCIVDKIMVMKFPPPAEGRTASVTYPFLFATAKK